MIPTQCAYRIGDSIHLPERHTVHRLIQLMKISLDAVIVHAVGIAVWLIEHGQDRISISKAGQVLCQLSF